jgi:hypothetical protein
MWELQANLIPKFGYCSQKFDDVAWGKSLVQGQLALNFVTVGYLIGALLGKTVTNTGSATPSAVDPVTAQQQQLQAVIQQIATLNSSGAPYRGPFSMREVIPRARGCSAARPTAT